MARSSRAGHELIIVMYLVKKYNPKVAHIWVGLDTACRMASTNGLNISRYKVVESIVVPTRKSYLELKVCSMCAAVTRRSNYQSTGNQHTTVESDVRKREEFTLEPTSWDGLAFGDKGNVPARTE